MSKRCSPFFRSTSVPVCAGSATSNLVFADLPNDLLDQTGRESVLIENGPRLLRWIQLKVGPIRRVTDRVVLQETVGFQPGVAWYEEEVWFAAVLKQEERHAVAASQTCFN